MKKLIYVMTMLVFLVLSGCAPSPQTKHIGVVLPMDHQAMREIVEGFKASLTALYKQPIQFKVANAEHDLNLERAILEQMHDAQYDLIVPITTGTAQMAASIIREQPIVALAADYSEKDRVSRFPINITAVDDEIAKGKIIDFIHRVYPSLKVLALVHSVSDKIFPEVEEVKQAAEKSHITLRRFMVNNLSELYGVGQAIPSDVQAIFILKDSLIASGIDTLIAVAKMRKIPLITSDDGTVAEGAGFAVGVHERQIGEEGAKLAARILKGTPAGQLPIVKITQPTVFVNLDALKQEQQNRGPIEAAAKQFHYSLEIVSHKS